MLSYCRPLPVTIEEITSQWLTAALNAYAPDITVRSFQIVDIKRGTCTKIRLRLDAVSAGGRVRIPETVILKGGFEPHSRNMGYMHEWEARGYRDVLPVLKLPSPISYFADYDPERRQGIIIMEDLVERGATFCSGLKPQTQEQVARRFSVLAEYHAKTWNSPDFRHGGKWDWVEDMLEQQRCYFNNYLKPEVWQAFIGSPRGAAVSVRFHDRHLMSFAVDQMRKLSQRLPHAIIHGDTHPGNLYIDPDGTPGFYDPLTLRAPPMSEVAYHMSCGLDTGERARWERTLIQHYLNELGRNGVEAPRLDDAMMQYGVFLAYAYCVFIINEAHCQTEAVNTAYTARISAAMLDHDTLRLLSAIT